MSAWNEYQEKRLAELEVENKKLIALVEMYDKLLDELQFPVSMIYKVKEIIEARDALRYGNV